MSEKVVIPKDIAAEIEVIRSQGTYADRYLLSLAFSYTFGKEGRTLHYYASENYDTYVNAIVNGYTVETTPEDNVRKYYEASYEKYSDADSGTFNEGYYDGVTDAIEYTLGMLGIKIEGVNA